LQAQAWIGNFLEYQIFGYSNQPAGQNKQHG
jgi:hypothetical protein